MEDKHIYRPQSKTDLKSLLKKVKGSINSYVKEAGIEDLPFSQKPAAKPAREEKINKTTETKSKLPEEKNDKSAKKDVVEIKNFTDVWSQYKPDPHKIPEETKEKIITTILLAGIFIVLVFAIVYASNR